MRVTVYLNHYGKRLAVGMLDDSTRIAFEYFPEFIETGIEISPYKLPLRNGVFYDEGHTFDGLFGVFNDSLPDGWGLLLLDRALATQGISFSAISPLARLCMMGANALGALEYEPDTSKPSVISQLDFDALAEESTKILMEAEACDPKIVDLLVQLNGSLAGARPKIQLSIENTQNNKHTEDWIIKFKAQHDPITIGALEYDYSLRAKSCGITMPETRLFPSTHCEGYFGIRRFDREKTIKKHVHTACGLLHASHRFPTLDYENLIRLTQNITKNQSDVEEMIRRMIFNVLMGNQDDHSKNFSFIMDETHAWRLAPAYDLTPSTGLHGEHCAMVHGKGKNISDDDLVTCAASGSITKKHAQAILYEVRNVL